jgi:excisionase family DNA binding protein
MSEQQVPAKLLLDIPEVASLLGLGRTHIYGYVMRGELPSLKLGRRRKVTVEAVREFVTKLQAEAESSGW